MGDSFKPVFSCERTKEGQLYYRIGIAVAIFSFCSWAVTKPSDFDGFVSAQGDFIKDLYAGTLLSEISQRGRENIDKPKMDSLEDLLKKIEDDLSIEEIPEDITEDSLDAMFDNLIEEEKSISSYKI